MAIDNIIEGLSKTLSQSSTARNVFGDPLTLPGKTILPVAKISYGFGGGSGPSVKQRKESNAVSGHEPQAAEGGGGGGLMATARGVFEITPRATRFIPAFSFRHFVLGVAAGFLLKAIVSASKKSR